MSFQTVSGDAFHCALQGDSKATRGEGKQPLSCVTAYGFIQLLHTTLDDSSSLKGNDKVAVSSSLRPSLFFPSSNSRRLEIA